MMYLLTTNRKWRYFSQIIVLTPHILRHTFATRASEAELTIKSLVYAMGHTTAQMSLDRYADNSSEHTSKEMQQKFSSGLTAVSWCSIPQFTPQFTPNPENRDVKICFDVRSNENQKLSTHISFCYKSKQNLRDFIINYGKPQTLWHIMKHYEILRRNIF